MRHILDDQSTTITQKRFLKLLPLTLQTDICSVSVPVLSEQITEVQTKKGFHRREASTMAFFLPFCAAREFR